MQTAFRRTERWLTLKMCFLILQPLLLARLEMISEKWRSTPSCDRKLMYAFFSELEQTQSISLVVILIYVSISYQEVVWFAEQFQRLVQSTDLMVSALRSRLCQNLHCCLFSRGDCSISGWIPGKLEPMYVSRKHYLAYVI